MSLQRVDALPGVTVPQLGREKHFESITVIKEIKSVHKRVTNPLCEHVAYSRLNVIMKIKPAVFVLITTHYAAGLEGQIIVRAVELMLFQGCICNQCLLTPLFSFSHFFFCLDFHCLSNPLFSLYFSPSSSLCVPSLPRSHPALCKK